MRKHERVVRRDGKVVEIDQEFVDTFKDKKGLRPVGRNGVSAAQRFSMSGAFWRFEQGPNGMWFYWDGGWAPAKTSNNGGFGWIRPVATEEPQPDPAGNIWVYSGSEWSLEDEIA